MLFSTWPEITFPARKHQLRLSGTKTEARACETTSRELLPGSATAGLESNSWPPDHRVPVNSSPRDSSCLWQSQLGPTI